jgi:O-antigen/teichoic acid export membrane protein
VRIEFVSGYRLPVTLKVYLDRARQHAVRRSFAWNVSIMLAGAVCGQAFSVLLSPVLTRLFTPEQFGQLSVYNSVLGVLSVVASLGLELAIPICLDDRECANLAALCGIALVATSGACTLLTWLLPVHVLSLLGVGSLTPFRYLLPVGLAWLGGYYIVVALATREGAFKEIARTRISQGVSAPVAQILLGALGAGTPGLVFGSILGQASGTLLLLSRVAFREARRLREISWRGIVAVARRYADFPLFASWARVLDVAGGGMILYVLFSACYSSEVAGFMFLSERVIMRPLIIVSSSLLQVFTGEAGRSVSQYPGRLRARFYQVVTRQFLFSGSWILLANLVAGLVFPLLFGAAWADAIPYLRALSLLYLLQAALHPVSTVLQVLERQRTAGAWQIGRLIVVIAGVLGPWWGDVSALGALWVSALIQASCCLFLLGLMMAIIEQEVAGRETTAVGADLHVVTDITQSSSER